MRVLLFLIFLWASPDSIHSAETPELPETAEEARWNLYFGPVTAAEKEVFADWRSERRKNYKEIEGSEAISIREMQLSGDLTWYSRQMLELAERKRFAQATKLASEPISQHTPDAIAVIANIKAAYAELNDYHEKVTIWTFFPNNNSNKTWRATAYESELWYSRTLGTHGHVDTNREWSQIGTDIWVDLDCVSQLTRSRASLSVDKFNLSKECESKSQAYLPALTLYHEAIGRQGIAAPLIQPGRFTFPPNGDVCSVPSKGLLLCKHPNNLNLPISTAFKYDASSYLINTIRWDTDIQGRAIAIYTLLDVNAEIHSDSLHLKVPSAATAWLSKRQGEIDAQTKKDADAYRTRHSGESYGQTWDQKGVPDLIASQMMHLDERTYRSDLKRLARDCDFQAFVELEASVKGTTDSKTGKPWSQIQKECTIKMTLPIVYERPPVFPPCPDWIKTCEEQLL